MVYFGVFRRAFNRVGLALLVTAGLCFAALPAASAGGVTVTSIPMNPILPDQGAYYTEGHGGTGLQVDVDPNGYVFAAFFAYNKDGSPTFYMLEGYYQPSSESKRVATGVIGRLDATPYISAGGECLGPDCVYKAPTRTATGLDASMVWTTPRQATLTIGSQTWAVQAGQYRVADASLLAGTWNLIVSRNTRHDGTAVVADAVVTVAKAAGVTAASFTSEGGAMTPPAGSLIYTVVPTVNPRRSTHPITHASANGVRTFQYLSDLTDHPDVGYYLYYDPATGQAGLVAADAQLRIGASATRHDAGAQSDAALYLHSTYVQGRLQWRRGGVVDAVMGAVTMQRVPASVRRAL